METKKEEIKTAEEVLAEYSIGKYIILDATTDFKIKPYVNSEFIVKPACIAAMHAYADQFASLQTAEVRKEMEWISVEDRLPEKSGQVLGVMKDTQDQYICFYKPGRKLFLVYGAGSDPISDMKVTHWMPLPEVPDPTYGEIPNPSKP